MRTLEDFIEEVGSLPPIQSPDEHIRMLAHIYEVRCNEISPYYDAAYASHIEGLVELTTLWCSAVGDRITTELEEEL